ncbi:unnamed protein product, partial [Prunus brigantina]
MDESAVAWRERGPIARNLTAEFEHEDENDGIAVDEAINVEDWGDDIVVDVDEEGDEGTVPEDINVENEIIYEEATKKWLIDALRPIVGLDDCHIKGQYPRQLLSAVSVDHNNSMYPIAYAVAEPENYATWNWFLELLAVDLGIENSNGYILDARDKSIITMLERIRYYIMLLMTSKREAMEKWAHDVG